MTKYLLVYFILFIFSTTMGQTIEELEYDLSWYSGSEKYGDKIDKAKKLIELDPFNYRATEYICRYYDDRNIDSVSIYFDNLIAKFPDNTEPYLLRSELLFLEHDYQDRDNYNKLKIKYLCAAYKINTSDQTIIFKLAEVYYKDFIYPYEKKKNWGIGFELEEDITDSTLYDKNREIKQSTFKHAADSALIYFYKYWDLNINNREVVYYPIRQLECYLGVIEVSKIPKDAESKFENCFFPSWYFANLNNEWHSNITVDYLFEIESAKGTADWLKTQLTDLKENCLYNLEIQPTTVIYRFTWLRSFHNPISIRIEKSNEEILLYWKIGRGSGGYEPQGLKVSGKKKLNFVDWDTFQNLVIKSDLDNLSNEKYVPMTDGATWTFERRTANNYKAHNTNWPNKEIKDACLFLLKLTNIKVKNDDIY